MKKLIYFSIALLLTGFLAGCDVNDEFNGLDDLTKKTNVAEYNYTLTQADYTSIGNKIQKPIADVIKVKEDLVKVYQDSLKNFAPTHADSIRINASITSVNNEISTLKLDPVYVLGGKVKANQYLTPSATSIDYVPAILNGLYKYGDYNSTAKVTFNYNLENLGYLSAFAGASKYTLTNANYTSVGGKVALLGAFTPSYPADNYLPTILSSAIASPSEGKLAIVTYKASSIEPSISDIPVIVTEFSEDFAANNLSKFVAYSVTGAQTWAASSGYASISGYASGNNENEDWLIIPSLDLSAAVSAYITFSTAHRYAGNDLVLKYSTDYSGSGDPSVATWTNLTYNYQPSDPLPSSYTWTSSGNVNLPGMPNSNVSIAFVYTSTASASSTWRIDNVSVNYKNLDSDIPVFTYNKCLKYTSGNWVNASNVLTVSPYEYIEMGGEPKQNGYFSSTAKPASYLPTYIKNKRPLAIEGDTCVVVYNYGNTTTFTADKYSFTNGTWTPYSGIIVKTDPFAFSSLGWVFDPTVNYTMVTKDYEDMVLYIFNHPTLSIFAEPTYKNEEFYYGFGNRYSNVSFRLSYRDPFYFAGKAYQKPASIDAELYALGTNEQKVALLWTRLEEGMNIFLQIKFPDAVPQINGVDVYYKVRVKVFAPDGVSSSITDIYEFKYKCIAAGAPATFEFVSKTKI